MRFAQMHVCPELRYLQTRALDSLVEIGVVEDDERGVAAELERHLLHLASALLHQELSDLGRAGEAELAHDRIRRHLASDRRRVFRIARNDVEHSRRQARFLGQLCDRECRQRRLLGGLENHRAAGRDRRRRLARDHRGREVPRSDAGGDADRLLDDDDAAVLHVRRNRVPVDTLGLLAEPLEERCCVFDLRARLGQRLPLLGRQEQRQVVKVLEHQIGPAAEDPCTLLREGRAPGRIRILCGCDRASRLVCAHAGHLRQLFARCRVDDRESRARVALDPLSPDIATVEQEGALSHDLRHSGAILRS